MIIRTIATALIQWTMRTQAGWMTFVVVAAAAGWSLTARLDMVVPWLFHTKGRPIQAYTPEPGGSLLPRRYQVDACSLWRSQKSEPGCPGSPFRHASCPGQVRRGLLRRRHQDGVDHVDHAVRLVDVGDRHHRGAALGVDDPDLAVLE